MTIKKKNQSLKNFIFPKGLTHAFGQKCQFFHFLFSLKIRLEIRFKNVPDRKETFFFSIKTKVYKVPKNCIFPNGLTHAFGQKMPNFSLFRFGQNKTRKSE